MGISR